jgi:hypothetical protein
VFDGYIAFSKFVMDVVFFVRSMTDSIVSGGDGPPPVCRGWGG